VARGQRLRLGVAGLVLLGVLGGAPGSASAAGDAQTRQAIVAPPTYALQPWTSQTDNLVPARGTIVLNGTPVSGARVRVDNYELPQPTDANGHFVYLVDQTLLARHVVTVADVSEARAAGRSLSDVERADLLGSRGAITVAYVVKDLKTSRDSAGRPVISGRLVAGAGATPPTVGLLTYRLTGTVTDASGKPVVGAQVSTRTLDRDYWTVSAETDKRGFYTSLFTASAESPGNPVPFTVRVSKGDLVYQFLPQEFVNFQRLQSARLDIRLPPRGYPMALPRPMSYPGAVYTGIAVGVTQGPSDEVVRPVAATWPDAAGRFQLTLPQSLAGKTVALWEAKLNLFSRAIARPGGPVDLISWPKALPRDVPRDLVRVQLAG
jgi:hypothetical protein